MSQRRRKHKKRFNCGHRGFGKYCHCCVDRQRRNQAELNLRRAQRQQLQQAYAQDEIDLRYLPNTIVRKARIILAALRQGVQYWQMGGKRLQGDRAAVRIPVTCNYRLLCRQESSQTIPLQVISHETYNPIVRSKRRLTSAVLAKQDRLIAPIPPRR